MPVQSFVAFTAILDVSYMGRCDASRAERPLAATGLRLEVPEVQWNDDEPSENVAPQDSEVSDAAPGR